MKMKPATLVNLILILVLIASTHLVGVTAQVSTYDPWADLDADGDIDIFDVVNIAGSYGETGDPTKTVQIGRHTTHEWTLVETLTFNGMASVENSTAGYNRVTITVSIDYNWHVYAYIGFSCNGSAGEIRSPTEELELWNVYTVTKTYDITGSKIHIRIWNSDAPSIDVKVGLYMTT
jgi:hypothetical protein